MFGPSKPVYNIAEDPSFQELCLTLDPSLQAGVTVQLTIFDAHSSLFREFFQRDIPQFESSSRALVYPSSVYIYKDIQTGSGGRDQ